MNSEYFFCENCKKLFPFSCAYNYLDLENKKNYIWCIPCTFYPL